VRIIARLKTEVLKMEVGKSGVLTVGDLNGDGHPDLIVANISFGGFAVLLGKGDGTLAYEGDFANGGLALAIGKFNGRPDVIGASNGFALLTSFVVLGSSE
jgi:hypothetical protein